MFGLINRGALPQVVENELEHLVGRLKGLWLAEHNEDGTHRVDTIPVNVPVGGIIQWPTDTAPTGWLLCRGQQVSRLDYKSLFDLIGTTYGSGDGSTTFNVPNMQQRFPLGKAAAGTGSTLGGTGGAIDHTHSASGLTTAANSTGTGTTGTGTTGTGTTGTGTSGNTAPNTGGPSSTVTIQDSGAGVPVTVADASHIHNVDSHSHSVPGLSIPGLSIPGLSVPSLSIPSLSVNAGSTDANNPPYIVLNYIIRT